jgi:streptogramin lyase
VPTGTLTTWEVPEDHNLWGLAFDDADRLWMTEWVGAGSNLYRFDPVATELCTYTLPSNSRSYYLLHDQGQLWLRNWDQYRIYRLDIASGQADWWQWDLGQSNAEPTGLALDDDGNLWWADAELGALARLEPDLDRMTVYTLPVGTRPHMLETGPGGVWYTEGVSGTVGLLAPASAASATTTLSTGSGSVTAECSSWDPSTTSPAFISAGTLSWTPGSVTTLVDAAGWTVYQLATGASPYGIAGSGGYVWAADQGRQKLLRLSAPIAVVAIEKHTNGQDADDPPGPSVLVGDPVTWSYRVENTGNVGLTDVTVVDDNGTPANPADDYTCVIGDLAAGVVDDVTCSQEGTAVAGQYANTATVSADAGAEPVSDADPSHYFGVGPGVNLEKSTNGVDADNSPGPSVPVGDPVTWSYRVENTGNVDLADVTVVDDNGTPANPADDYACVIGNLGAGAVDDTTCSQDGTAVAGQYANTATVTAVAGATPVSDSDPSHYLGQDEKGNYVFLPIVLKRVTP